MYYSKSKNGFYSPDIHGSYFIERVQTDEDGMTIDRWLEPDPDGPIADAVEITYAEHRALIDGQSNGKQINGDDQGRPFLAGPPPPEPQTINQVYALRATAYADPQTGSDRYFLEAARKRAEDDATGADSATAEGLARVAEIKAGYPLP